jgi:hypothetical protein
MGFPNSRITNRTSGAVSIANTTQVNGDFVSIDVMTDTKFEVLTGNLTGAANAIEASAHTIEAGTTIDGYFTAIKLHSGTVIAYRK